MLQSRFPANAPNALVFAPPIATFRNARSAAESDLVNGVCISVEIDDGNTEQARQHLERLLGQCTVSGGECADPETGELFPKLHLHWRLSEPTRQQEEHAALKDARRLACALVKADPTAKPLYIHSAGLAVGISKANLSSRASSHSMTPRCIYSMP
jgi:hypothetical protein